MPSQLKFSARSATPFEYTQHALRGSRLVAKRMLPHADYLPSGPLQCARSGAVACLVALQLRSPVFQPLRRAIVGRTTVPEAAVDEYRHALTLEREIGSAR